MKKDRSTAWPAIAALPSATMIDAMAIASGTATATTAPKTSSSTISAAGRPNCSSPFSRSCRETVVKSLLSVQVPVIATDTPYSASSAWTASITSRTSVAGSAPSASSIATRSTTALPSCDVNPLASAA